MIEAFIINEKTYIKLSANEWRYSAAALGLMKYFDFLAIPIVEKEVELLNEVEIVKDLPDQALIVYESETGFEYLCFAKALLTEASYFDFVRKIYSKDLYPLLIQEQLKKSQFNDDELKEINSWLAGNTVMKSVFSKMKFDGQNKQEILTAIEENRDHLTKESFRYKKNLYANYNNTYQLCNESGDCCRLTGYSLDVGKKGRSSAYNFNAKTKTGIDSLLFDWVPFAFNGDREAFFINANRSLKQLKQTHTFLSHQIQKDHDENKNNNQNVRYSLFNSIIHSAGFIDEDVEVIYKNRERDFFETLYIRKESMKILKTMGKIDFINYKSFCFSLKINDNYYIDIQEKVTNCILNLILTDELIELFLKQKNGNDYLISQFIEINWLIRRGGEMMKKKMSGAYACAKEVVKKIPTNKIESYRQKLTSAIVFKDYDRVCQILLQLSNYSDVSFNFAYDLFEDFENNKDIAYTFINALRNETDYKTKNEGGTQA
ncbi:type I CRISPR-associated protein Cas8a1/Csx8 [Acetobacterium sp. UBA5834]|uniref:type I CRISPR-associated protein Cas8a1/Csx8 n=1 Tax=Acetobacterium sp. UBA5834 TaxID=1945907 RepID=UPI00257B8F0E|nr:type I CRISPR-associated protein Cas8a1/Csx8 [Acetobacterium sp. UBA5834]